MAALTIAHPYVSAIPDSGDSSLVQPSNWNADHNVLADATGTIGYLLTAQGASLAPIWSNIATLNASGSPTFGLSYVAVQNELAAYPSATTGAGILSAFGYGIGTTLNGPQVRLFGAAGTSAVPTGLGSADRYMFLTGGAYHTGGAYRFNTGIAALTTEAQTNIAGGCELQFYTTPNGSTTRGTAVIIGQDKSLTIFGTTVSTSYQTGALIVAGGVGIDGRLSLNGTFWSNSSNASIELGALGSANTPFIDFHSGATTVDYDSRIIASGGTGVASGGSLTLQCTTLLTSAQIYQSVAGATATTINIAATAGQQSRIYFTDGSTAKWSLLKNTDNSFSIYDEAAANTATQFLTNGVIISGNVLSTTPQIVAWNATNDTNAAYFMLRKSRALSGGGLPVLLSDTLGTVLWQGSDSGGTLRNACGITGYVGAVSVGTTTGNLQFFSTVGVMLDLNGTSANATFNGGVFISNGGNITSSAASNGTGLVAVANITHNGSSVGDGPVLSFYWQTYTQLGGQIGIYPRSSGTADLLLRTANSSTMATKLSISAAGSVIIGDIVTPGALATNATAGFLYIPTCAGTPTGVPTAYTGKVALVYDTTNNKFYIYNAAWKGGTAPGAWT